MPRPEPPSPWQPWTALERLLRRLVPSTREPREDPAFDPDALVRLISQAPVDGASLGSGHLHIHVSGFSEHLLLVWEDGMLREVAAKSARHASGRCGSLRNSAFRRHSPHAVLARLRDRLAQVRLHCGSYERTWTSFAEFRSWLRSAPR